MLRMSGGGEKWEEGWGGGGGEGGVSSTTRYSTTAHPLELSSYFPNQENHIHVGY